MIFLRVLIGLPLLALLIGVFWAIGHRIDPVSKQHPMDTVGLGFMAVIATILILAIVVGIVGGGAWLMSFIFWH